MDWKRRRLLIASVTAALAARSLPAEGQKRYAGLSTSGIDAAHLGLNSASSDDQTSILQRAIDTAAGQQVPLILRPGVYWVGTLKLKHGSQLLGVPGATRLLLTQGTELLVANFVDRIVLSGLTIDGNRKPIPSNRGLVQLANARRVRISECEITRSGGQGIVLDNVEGEVSRTTIDSAANCGLFSLNAKGLIIRENIVRRCGNNGIQVWRSDAGDDGSIVAGNRIEETGARGGGSGQNGNAINVFRAANVIVSGNRIVDSAFSAVRGNAASNLQVIGNSCRDCGEVALYSEFGFEGAVIANNTVDGAAVGVSVTNFDHGGRLAVVQGNLIRRLFPKRPAGTNPTDGAGNGISVEADTAVTGNVIEDAPSSGIVLGWGHHLRDVTAVGNIIRNAGIGITVSVSRGAGSAVIANNLITDSKSGAIVGMDFKHRMTGDLAKDGAGRYLQLAISGNQVR